MIGLKNDVIELNLSNRVAILSFSVLSFMVHEIFGSYVYLQSGL